MSTKVWPTGPRGYTHLLFHLVAPIVLFVIGIASVAALLDAAPANCDYGAEFAPLPSYGLFGAGLVAFYIGRKVSMWGSHGTYTQRVGWTRFIQYGTWFWLFVLVAFVFIYEAIGTAHVGVGPTGRGGFEPITYYVRCAAYIDSHNNPLPLGTITVIAAVSGILGHWLWAEHPSARLEHAETAMKQAESRS